MHMKRGIANKSIHFKANQAYTPGKNIQQGYKISLFDGPFHCTWIKL